jgi:starch phosphorylase
VLNNLHIFQVIPNIPEPLFFLEILSKNLWWSWQADAIELFMRIDPGIWEESNQNPIDFLTKISQDRLEALTKDDGFLSDLEEIKKRFERQILSSVDRSESAYGQKDVIAYFSMEFGLHSTIPFFAGGLGILAGDHLKAASDRAMPLVGIGLFYRHGYFHQFLGQDGFQQEKYIETNIYHLPVQRVYDASGNDLVVCVPGPEGDIYAIVWKMMVGRIPLYLLDTNISKNSPENQNITSKLYLGDQKIRISQEILLGIGGIRALSAMGITPTVCHLNEGHAAFASLERLRQIILTCGVDFKTAMEIVPRTTIFTTHTPVAAGYDEFPINLTMPVLNKLAKDIGCDAQLLMSCGQAAGALSNDPFSMFILGLKMSSFCNGVSKLHGEVARKMWANVWPGRRKKEIPIDHVTNGVHIPSWISHETTNLFDRYLGTNWSRTHLSEDMVNRIDNILDEELWRIHQTCRSRLVGICRQLIVKQYGRRNAPQHIMKTASSVLDHDSMTIAFARRFTSYKRAYLLLMDPDRLKTLISSVKRPVQFIFAGKAHPKDNEGKDLIKRIVEFARDENLRHRFIFLENYNIHTSKYMLQGADVWLNTPRRPFEACGTSGMKAAVNGVLNVSTFDGWWCEGYDETRGWKIGGEDNHTDYQYQDSVESHELYNVLENSVIPLFYERKNSGIPSLWIKMMKESMKVILRQFSSFHMASQYEKKYYIPIAKQLPEIMHNGAEKAKILKLQREHLFSNWKYITVKPPEIDKKSFLKIGDTVRITTEITLGVIDSKEVKVELYHGILEAGNNLSSEEIEDMSMEKETGNASYMYACTLTCNKTGRHGFTVRVKPKGDNWIENAPGLITWA